LSYRPILTAALAAALAASWQAATAHYNFDGDWAAFFHTGKFVRMPAEIDAEQPFRFDGLGYDGQFYHAIAHDPLGRHSAGFVDNPPMRWRRILIPALAWVFGLGDDSRIDSAYFAVVLAFTALGAFWLERRARGWGLAFLAVPATITSLDRMTVDIGLAAFCLAPPGIAILTLAPLARDSGICLVAAAAIWHGLNHRWRAAAWSCAAALPAALWALYVRASIPVAETRMLDLPFRGLVSATIDHGWRDLSSDWLRTAWWLDDLALWGVWLAVAAAGWLAIRRDHSYEAIAAAMFALLAIILARPQFLDAYSFTRTQTPLMILVALAGVKRRSWWMLAPVALALPRLLFQLGPQWKGILRGVLS
jgi:hypothetical protein